METKKIRKVLIAHRGEIAKRVIRACQDLCVGTVAIYSKEDIYSEHRIRADESYMVGESLSPLGAYLAIDEIVDLARRKNVDAIHPGYGFLSETAAFAKACEDAGIIFIGPNSEVLGKMGDKLSAKEIALEAKVETIPGSKEPLKDADEAVKLANSYGYPIILKAAAGGGGRGMRSCWNDDEVRSAFELVQGEAKKAFGNDNIFIEKFLVEPKHIEVQILADSFGNTVHLFERDCSLQRRYQKVVEYTPAWSLDERTRANICADAVKIAKTVKYENAGTVEFLVDKLSGNHYFIEMNPRIQVEHTVTEMVTGVDLVRVQILIADGAPLADPLIGIRSQDDVHIHGYAIQCRITTEDPANGFAPDTGRITAYRSSGGNGVRLDGNAYVGFEISPYYDSLLCKVTCFDNSFKGTVRKAIRALGETTVRGVKTNVSFIGNIL
ncbi:MAG: acetyl-CoA carboxylase biotin carboxylase subunit, partial [Spirochaetales bacterium]|nr:acetyl-CoA carboxylase biotin carboxylase subunit [Spirochaetales bacterium]